MSVITSSTEMVRVSTSESNVSATIHYPTAEQALSPPRVVMICDPLPLLGDASDDLTESLIAALLDAGVTVATYEPRCRNLILEDYDAYTAPQSLVEATSVWKTAMQTGAHAESPDTKRCLVACGVGAIIALASLNQISDSDGVCLINPATPADIHSVLTRETAGTQSTTMLPRSFIRSVSGLNIAPQPSSHTPSMLCIAGAADSIINPNNAHTLASTARLAEWKAQAVLVAGGDHTLSEPQARIAAVKQIINYCLNMSTP